MNDSNVVIVFVLLVYLVISHAAFLALINVLVNKAMSRSFGEYQANKKPKEKKVTPLMREEIPNTGPLEGIGI